MYTQDVNDTNVIWREEWWWYKSKNESGDELKAVNGQKKSAHTHTKLGVRRVYIAEGIY